MGSKNSSFSLSTIAFKPVALIFLNRDIGILLIMPNLVDINKYPSSKELTTTKELIDSPSDSGGYY